MAATKSAPGKTALAAAIAEAEKTEDVSVDFEFDGETYTVTTEDVDNPEFMLELEQGHIASMMKSALGDGQWTLFMSKKRRSIDLAKLANAMFEATSAVGLEK